MEPKAKLSKEMICEETRFILANILAEGRYGKQNHLDDIRRICEGAVSLGLDEYIVFLESYGYVAVNRRSDTLEVTSEGERVVSGDKTQELMGRVLAHFLSRPQGVPGTPVPRRARVVGTPPPPGAAASPPPATPATPAAPELAEPPAAVAANRIVRDIASREGGESPSHE